MRESFWIRDTTRTRSPRGSTASSAGQTSVRLWVLPRLPTARAGEMMIDLTAHRRCLAHHRLGQVIGSGRRRIHYHGQRCFERVRKIAGMAPCFFSLSFIMFKQAVKLIGERGDFIGQHRAL